MTAELSDAFENRARGVVSIAAMFAREIGPGDIAFYAGARGFVSRAEVAEAASAIASANWRASAELVARHCADALFIDMGSTTTDLVPIRGGAIVALSDNDAGRLANGELVYAGLVARRVRKPASPWFPSTDAGRRSSTRVSPPWPTCIAFSATFPKAPTSCRPRMDAPRRSEASRARLARLVGRDAADASDDAWRDLAAFLARAQMRLVEDGVALLRSRGALTPDAPIVGAGVGRGVIAQLAREEGRAYHDFDEFLDAVPQAKRAASDCAPAAAIALILSM